MSAGDRTADLGPTCPDCGRDLREESDACPCCAATVTKAKPAALPEFTGPREIAGYRTLRELGAGGMATVFEAYQEAMQRRVALKVLSRHLAPSAKADRRFEREAWIGGKLDHANIVKVYERGEWEDLSFYSMELVDGGSLHDVIINLKRWGRDDRLGLQFGSRDYVVWAIERVIDAAHGLEHAHRHRVVHRDVKPMNLLLSSEQGCVKVADFGLAVDEDVSRLTTTGKVLGTLAYMAPEQILARREEIGPATDVYALGVTLFELLTLEYPFTGETRELYLNAVLTSQARRPSKLNERIGRDLEIVIGKALEKRPRDRYHSAGALAEDLENVLHFRPIRARPTSWPARLVKWVRRKPVHAALLGTLLLAAPVTAFLGFRAFEHRRLVRELKVGSLWREAHLLNNVWDVEGMLDRARQILKLDADHTGALRSRAINAMHLALATNDAGVAASYSEESLDALARLERNLPAASWPFRLRSYVMHRLGREHEARLATARAEALQTSEPADDDLYFAGLLAQESGDNEQAVALLSRLIARRPSRRSAVMIRAEALEGLGDTKAAIRDLERVAAQAPEDAVTRFNLGRLLVREGRLDEAEEHLREASRLMPGQAAIHQGLSGLALARGRLALYHGETDMALGFFREAESAARHSLELDELPFTHSNLGASLSEQYRALEHPEPRLVDEAIEHYERELALWRERDRDAEVHAVTLSNLCDAYLQINRLDEVLAVCVEAAELSPDDAVDQYNLAGAHALLGQMDDAFAALQRDFELGDRDHEYLASDPWFESLHDDPRFSDLLERMRRDAG